MAGPKVNPGFKANELVDDADVEKLETQEQPAPDQPTGLTAEEQPPQQQPEPEKPREEAIPYEKWKLEHEANQRLERELAEHKEFRARLDERQRPTAGRARAHQVAFRRAIVNVISGMNCRRECWKYHQALHRRHLFCL